MICLTLAVNHRPATGVNVKWAFWDGRGKAEKWLAEKLGHVGTEKPGQKNGGQKNAAAPSRDFQPSYTPAEMKSRFEPPPQPLR